MVSFCFFSRTTAQDETQTYTLMLTADAPAEMIYTAQAGEAVSIAVGSLDDIDTTLSVFAPDGERIGFSDDLQIFSSIDGLFEWGDRYYEQQESILLYLVLPVTGDYTLVIDSFNGVQEGEVSVRIWTWPVDIVRTVEETDNMLTMNVSWLTPHQRGYRYTFEATAGEIVTITARDIDNALDPRLVLLDVNGVELASNDDHLDVDLTLDVLDARIADFVVPADGSYTVVVSDFLGRAGAIEVTIAWRANSDQP